VTAVKVVGAVGLLSVLISLGCDDGPTQATDQFGPVRSLTLSVTPDRLANAGPITIELRATTDPGMRIAPDAVGLALVTAGRETPNPVQLDEDGAFTQRLYLSTSTIVRATGGSIVVERLVSVDVPTGGAPQPVPPAPQPPAPVPAPSRPSPGVTVTLTAAPSAGTTATTFVFTASATPVNGAGPVVSFDWDEDGDGTFELLAKPNPLSVVFATAGSKTVAVRANSSTAGVSGTASAVVAVGPVGPLTVTLTATPECARVGEPIVFRAISTGGTGRPIAHDWDFESDGVFDPPQTVSDTVAHAYDTPGTITARVRVTTTTGEEAFATRAVSVRPTTGTCQ
jgi:hypothetical protein